MNHKPNYSVFYNIKYGKDIYNIGDLYIPLQDPRGLVCLFHGGFWKMPYDKSQLNNVAESIASIGFAVWNVEYRRVGCLGGGYPGTFKDILNAVNHIEQLINEHEILKNKPIVIAGHSAGGQLAFWLESIVGKLFKKPKMLIGLAPVVDLEKCFNSTNRKDFVLNFLRYSPEENIDLYKKISPIRLMNIDIPKIIIHGVKDSVLPINESVNYVKKIRKHGGEIKMYKISDGEHMDFINHTTKSTEKLRELLLRNFD
ncbi:MAG: alpha/beta hydrolase family protein [Mobilitalea sp.]